GIDIDEACKRFDEPANRIAVRIGEQQDPQFLKSLVREFGPFDLIIDDGSHVSSHMIASFNFLFDPGLKEGGIYLVEDTHASYWPTHRDCRQSFIDFTKDIIDLMHAHYIGYPSEELFRYKADSLIAHLE